MGKVIRPILRRVLPRERLFTLLDDMRQRPVIWISGPPGCGKTTLVNSYLEARKVPCLWYQVEEVDADPATFFYYLGQAERRIGSKEREPLPLFTPEYLQGLPAFTLRYFENLYSRLKAPRLIVFDSYQNAPVESPLHEIMLHGLSALREGIKVIFISRSEPPPALMRFQAEERIATLGWDKLRFTLEETAEIVRLRSRRAVGRKEIVGWHKASDGWVAGLMLMCGRDRLKNPKVKPAGDFIPEEVFEDSAAEIFNRAGEELRHFLLKTSFVPQMTAKMAEELTGLSSANRILSILSRSHYFIEERLHPESWYQYHPLLKEFLLSKAKDFCSAEERYGVLQRAGRLLEGFGRPDDAAQLYIEGKDWDNFIRLTIVQAPDFVKQGRFKALEERIRSVPQERMENHPWLLYWLGMCQAPFNSEAGVESFKKAFGLFQRQRDTAGSYLAWSGVVILLTTEQNDCALLAPWVEWLTANIRLNPAFPSPEIEARVSVSLAGALLMLWPQHPDLENWMIRSLEISRKIGDLNLNIRAHINAAHWCQWVGDMTRCGTVHEELEKMAPSPSASPVLTIVKKWMEACLFNLGPTADYASALCRVREGLQTARETGIYFWNAPLLTQGVVACLNKGDLAKAGEFLREMPPTIKSTQRGLFSHYHYLSAWYHLLARDYARALFDAKTAVNLAVEIGASSQEILCRLAMAHVLKSSGEMKNANLQLNIVGELIPRFGTSVLEYLHLMAKAQFLLDEGDESSGLEVLRRALALGRSQEYISMFYWWNPPALARMCAKALAEGIEVGFVQNLIRKRNLSPDALGRTLENWPWPLKIFTLGRFKLETEGIRLAFPGKAPQKALFMLKALIALGGKDVSEEQITDLLWPESEGDTAHMAFKTLLSRLRQLLGVRDAIELQGGEVSFNSETCWLDTWAFVELYSQAKKAWEDKRMPETVETAIRFTEDALALYKGNFLPCHQGHDWTLLPRERLGRKFIFLISRLGDHLQEGQRWKEAVEHYEKAIEVDPLPEEFYQNLMNCYLQLGQSNEGIAVYKRFRKIISEDGGIVLSRKTEALYQCLQNGQTRPIERAA